MDVDQCECEDESYVVQFNGSKNMASEIPVNKLFSLTNKNDLADKYSYVNRLFEHDSHLAFSAIDNSNLKY